MPFDATKMCGKWKIAETSDSFAQVMAKMGVPKEELDMMMGAEFPLNISQSGDTVTASMDFMGKTIENTNTYGVEGEEVDHHGKKRRVTYTLEGDSLVAVYPDYDGKGLQVRTCRKFVDDNTMREDLKVGDLEGWATSKRC